MSRKVTLIASAALVAGVATTALASTFGGVPTLGPASHARVTVYKGYYDGHPDKYLVLDVSSKAQAAALHINYSPRLGHVKGAPPQYCFQGTAAPGQVSVFGLTEPGKPNYTPLWEELFVTWKPGVTPVLFKVDDDITAAAKAGKLTIRDMHVVINTPIISVGK